jgi:hypothetical protein
MFNYIFPTLFDASKKSPIASFWTKQIELWFEAQES